MTAPTITIAALTARANARPLGPRQAAILAYLRLREAGGQLCPSNREIITFLQISVSTSDIEASLIALQARGLIDPVIAGQGRAALRAKTWRVTAKGWAQA